MFEKGGIAGERLISALSIDAQVALGNLFAQAELSYSRQLELSVQSSLIRATGAHSRGVKTDAFYMSRNPTTPAILMELGYGSPAVVSSGADKKSLGLVE